MVLSNLEDADESILHLVAAADAGEDVVLARAGKPAFRLVRVAEPDAEPSAEPERHLDFRIPDQCKGQIWMSEDFDDEITGLEDDDDHDELFGAVASG